MHVNESTTARNTDLSVYVLDTPTSTICYTVGHLVLPEGFLARPVSQQLVNYLGHGHRRRRRHPDDDNERYEP